MPYWNNKRPMVYKQPSLEEIQKLSSQWISKPIIDVRPVNTFHIKPRINVQTDAQNRNNQTQQIEQPVQRQEVQQPIMQPTPQETNVREMTSNDVIKYQRAMKIVEDIRKQHKIPKSVSSTEIWKDYMKQVPDWINQVDPEAQQQAERQQIAQQIRLQHNIPQNITDEQILQDYDQQTKPEPRALLWSPAALAQQKEPRWLLPRAWRLDPTFKHDWLVPGTWVTAPDYWKLLWNVPSSWVNVASDTYNMFAHPIQTAQWLASLVWWVTTKIWAKPIMRLIDKNFDRKYPAMLENAIQKWWIEWRVAQRLANNEAAADMVWEHLTERYWSWQKIAKTMTEDPLGMISDIVTVLEWWTRLWKVWARATARALPKTPPTWWWPRSTVNRIWDQLWTAANVFNDADPYYMAMQGWVKSVQAWLWALSDWYKAITWKDSFVDKTKYQAVSQLTWLPEEAVRIALDNPNVAKSALRWDYTAWSLVDDITNIVQDLERQSWDTWRQYQALYDIDRNFNGRGIVQWARKQLQDMWININEAWKVNIDPTKYTMQNWEQAQIQRMVNTLKAIEWKDFMTIEELHNIRKNIDSATQWNEWIAKRKSRAWETLRKSIDNQLKTIPERKKLDGHFAQVKKSIWEIKKIFFTKSWELKRWAFWQMKWWMLSDANAQQLAVLERYAPNISDKIKWLKYAEAMKNVKNLKPWQYTKSILLWAMWSWLAWPLWFLLGWLTLNPEAVINTLQRLSKRELKVLSEVAEWRKLNEKWQQIIEWIQKKIKEQQKALPEPTAPEITPEWIIRQQNPVTAPQRKLAQQQIKETWQKNISQPRNQQLEIKKQETLQKQQEMQAKKDTVQNKYEQAPWVPIKDVSKFKEWMITKEWKIVQTWFNWPRAFYRVEWDWRFNYRYSWEAKAVWETPKPTVESKIPKLEPKKELTPRDEWYQQQAKTKQKKIQTPEKKTKAEIEQELLEKEMKQVMKEIKNEAMPKMDKEIMKRILEIETMEQNLGKVWRNKIKDQTYKNQQRQRRTREKEKIIERIKEEKWMNQFEAVDEYDRMLERAWRLRAENRLSKWPIDNKLIQEARKYDYANWFIADYYKKPNILKWGWPEVLEWWIPKIKHRWAIFLTENTVEWKHYAEWYSKLSSLTWKSKVHNIELDKNAKIFDIRNKQDKTKLKNILWDEYDILLEWTKRGKAIEWTEIEPIIKDIKKLWYDWAFVLERPKWFILEWANSKYKSLWDINSYAIFNPDKIKMAKTETQLKQIREEANKPKPLKKTEPKVSDDLIAEAKKYKSADEFAKKTRQVPKTLSLRIKSKFSDKWAYKEIPVVRRIENAILYQWGEGSRQFRTRNKKYAEQFGKVKEKKGVFYQVDNGNRVTDVYVEAESQLRKIREEANSVRFSAIQEARKYKSADDFVNSKISKDYRTVHQIDTKNASSITNIKESVIDEFTKSFIDQYGYPALKSKDVKRLKTIMRNPDADITIYRASPKNELNSWDWVTVDRDYANDIKRQNWGKVYSYTVQAKDLFYPITKDWFEDLPSLSKRSSFQYQDTNNISQLRKIREEANSKIPRLSKQPVKQVPVMKQSKEFTRLSWVIKQRMWADIITSKTEFNKNLWTEWKKYMNSWWEVYWYVKNDKIYINPEFMKSQTLMHEATHLWYDIAKKKNPSLVAKWRSIVKSWLKSWDTAVKNLYQDTKKLYKWKSESMIFEEMLAKMTEDTYIERIQNKSIAKRVQNFVSDVYNRMKDLIKWKSVMEYTTKDMQNMSMQDFSKMVMRNINKPLQVKDLTTIERNKSLVGRLFSWTKNATHTEARAMPRWVPEVRFSIWDDVSPKGKKLWFQNRWEEAIFDRRADMKSQHSWSWKKFLELIEQENKQYYKDIRDWKYTIKKIPEEYIEFERRLARNDWIELPGNTEQAERMIIETRQQEIQARADYLDWNSDYSQAFKNYVLGEITRKVLVSWMVKKRKANMVTWYLQVDWAAISDFYASWKKDFLKEYSEILSKKTAERLKFQESIKKSWIDWKRIKFDKWTDWTDLSWLACWTPRCTATKSTADWQLKKWDFYVFATKWPDWVYNKSRVAIRMENWKVREVRWIKEKQYLESEMLDIAKEKYISLPWWEKRIQKDYNARMLTSIEEKMETWWKLTKQELEVLYEVKGKSETFGYWDSDPRVKEFQEIRDNQKDLSIIFEVKKDEVEILKSQYSSLNIENWRLNPKTKVIYNAEWFRFSKDLTDLWNLKIILWNVYFGDSQVTNLWKLESIWWYADFSYSQVTNLWNLKTIWWNAYFPDSQVTNLWKLESIWWYADFSYSQVTNLWKLESVLWDIDFRDSQVTNLWNLKTIWWNVDFRDSQITNLWNLKSIWWDIDFRDSQIINLWKLETIWWDIDFRDSQVTNLWNLKSIWWDANFPDSQITNLWNLESIWWSVYFQHSQITNLWNLKSIWWYANFRDSQVTNLWNLKSILWNAYFQQSQVTNLWKLETIWWYADFSYSQVNNLWNLESIWWNAYFGDTLITNLWNLKSIWWDADFRDSQIINLWKLETIWWDANFRDSQVNNLWNLKTISWDVYFRDSQINLWNLIEKLQEISQRSRK